MHRRHELNTFLKTNNPDIVLLNETNLQDSHKVEFKNYNFVRKNRTPNTLQRGSGILVKGKFKFTEIDTRCWGLTSLECTAISLETNWKPLVFVAAYRNPSDNQSPDFTTDLDKICNSLQNNEQLIIGGDFNAHHTIWQDTKECRHGRMLADWLLTAPMQHEIKLEFAKEPTFYRGKHRSNIDLFIVSESIHITYDPLIGNMLDIADFNSDHRGVILPINIKGQWLRNEKRTFANYGKANWNKLKRTVESTISDTVIKNRNMTVCEIDFATAKISQLITDAAKESIPTTTIRQYSLLNLPPDLTDLIEVKNRLRRQWQRNRYNYDAHLLKSQINNLNKIIQDKIRIVHAANWTETLKEIKMDNNVFKNINKVTARTKRQKIPNLISNTTIAETDTQKCEVLAEHFERVHTTNLNIGDQVFTDNVNNEIETIYNNNHRPNVTYSQYEPADPSLRFNGSMHITSIDKLMAIIKTRNNKKSAGMDQIPNTIIRKLGKNFIATFATLLNQMYNIGYFPAAWKTAKITAIHKQGKIASDPNSYRPISLLPCLGKIYERILCEKLVSECDDKQTLPDDQFGFRSERSTVHPLVTLQKEIVTNFAAKTPTIAVTLDIQKAFDTTWTNGLIYKLKNVYGINDQLCRNIHNYLQNRKFCVNINDTLSNERAIVAGVPQGGVLSATLYILYTADMPLAPHHRIPIKRLQYADDILLYISTRNIFGAKHRLESYLTTLIEYFRTWKLTCNIDKSDVIIFKGQGRQVRPTKAIAIACKNVSIDIANHQILPKNTLKYLGVILETNGRHTRHIDHILKKSKIASAQLRPVLKKIQGLKINIKMLCYKQLIRPLFTYGFPCWTNITSSQMERLRRAERTCIRACTNYRKNRVTGRHTSNATLYKTAEIDRIDVVLVRNAIKFFEKTLTHDSHIISNICSTGLDERFNNMHKIKPPDHLFQLHKTDNLTINNQLLHYHRRFNSPDGQLVYNTAQ